MIAWMNEIKPVSVETVDRPRRAGFTLSRQVGRMSLAVLLVWPVLVLLGLNGLVLRLGLAAPSGVRRPLVKWAVAVSKWIDVFVVWLRNYLKAI